MSNNYCLEEPRKLITQLTHKFNHINDGKLIASINEFSAFVKSERQKKLLQSRENLQGISI